MWAPKLLLSSVKLAQKRPNLAQNMLSWTHKGLARSFGGGSWLVGWWLWPSVLKWIFYNKMGIIIYFLPISSNKMCEAPDEYTGFNLYIPTISKPAYLIPLWSPCNLLLFLIGPKLWLNGPKKISRESLPVSGGIRALASARDFL